MHCEYLGLNHLGWVRRILLRGEDVTGRILESDEALRSLYQADLFDCEADSGDSNSFPPNICSSITAAVVRSPTNALRAPRVAKRSAGSMTICSADSKNSPGAGEPEVALATYIDYLNQRSGSYMQLEAHAGTAFDDAHRLCEDPFRVATGYHRIALDVMNALCSDEPLKNRRQCACAITALFRGGGRRCGRGALPCAISRRGVEPEMCGSLPEEVRGLVLAVKAYERAAIQAATTGSAECARKAMLLYPAIGEWDPSADLLRSFSAESPCFPRLQ